MSFQFLCPQGHLLQGDPAQQGMQTQCPLCGLVFVIPHMAGPAPGAYGHPQQGHPQQQHYPQQYSQHPSAGYPGAAPGAEQFAPAPEPQYPAFDPANAEPAGADERPGRRSRAGGCARGRCGARFLAHSLPQWPRARDPTRNARPRSALPALRRAIFIARGRQRRTSRGARSARPATGAPVVQLGDRRRRDRGRRPVGDGDRGDAKLIARPCAARCPSRALTRSSA